MSPGLGPHTPHVPDPVDLEELAPCPVAPTFRPALPAFLGNVFPFASLRFVMTQTWAPFGSASRMRAAAAFLPELARGDFSLKVLSFWGSGPLVSCHHLLGKQSGHALMLLLEFNWCPSLSFDSHLAFPAHQGHLFSLLTLGSMASFVRRS